MAKYDDMSFGKAFAKARKEKGAGKTFTWRGDSYTTNYKEEKGESSSAPKTSTRPKARPSSDKPTRPKARPKPEARKQTDPRVQGGRGDGMAEMNRRRLDTETVTTEEGPRNRGDERRNPTKGSSTTVTPEDRNLKLNGVTLREFLDMTRLQRLRKSLPLTVRGFKEDAAKGYNKGGMVGHSDKRKGMFYKSGSPKGLK